MTSVQRTVGTGAHGQGGGIYAPVPKRPDVVRPVDRDRIIAEIADGISEAFGLAASYRTLFLTALGGWHSEQRAHDRAKERLYALRDELRAARNEPRTPRTGGTRC